MRWTCPGDAKSRTADAIRLEGVASIASGNHSAPDGAAVAHTSEHAPDPLERRAAGVARGAWRHCSRLVLACIADRQVRAARHGC